MEGKPGTNEESHSRWPGVFFSLLVPGFGLFRGRQYSRGIKWLLGLQFAVVIVALLLALEEIPLSIAGIALALVVVANIWMLKDSFCYGNMTVKLWGLFTILLALAIVLPTPGSFIARQFKIPSGDMEPTLVGKGRNGVSDHIIVDRISYLLGEPKRGDLIVFNSTREIARFFRYPEETETVFTKRLVGLPGEQIEIRGGNLYADGRKLSEADGIPPITYSNRGDRIFSVKEGEFFLLGDNSPDSADSRHWGCIPRRKIIGKVTKIYYPFNRMGTPSFSIPSSEQAQLLNP